MYCRLLQKEIANDHECLLHWNKGQKKQWLKRQMEEYGTRKRISRRECKLVNLFVKAADCQLPVPKEEIMQ